MNNMYEHALEILKQINENGLESYIIGGYARDKYLNIENNDIDICTNARLKDLKKIFGEIKKNKFGSYKIEYKENIYEITTYRREFMYLNNRFPKKILYTKKLKTDLKRRDFTINTLCIDEFGNHVDLLNAKKDIDDKVIKLVGTKRSLKKDALRTLRAIRFATTLNFKLDEKLKKAIIKYGHLLSKISNERKKQELEKIFASSNAEYGIYLIQEFGLQRYLDIDLTGLVIVDDLQAMWAQVLIDDSYNFNKTEKKTIKLIKKLMNKKFDLINLYKYGPDILSSVIKIQKEDMDVYQKYNDLQIKDRQDIDIDFFQICDVINVNNETISIIYDDIEKKIVYGEIKNKKEDILKYIKKKYQKS